MIFIAGRRIYRPYSRALQQRIFSLLQRCESSKTVIQIHAQILVNGFCQKNFLLSKLIKICIGSGDLLSSKTVIQIHAQILVNGFCQKNFLLSKLIKICIGSGDLLHARQAFEQMDNPHTAIYNHMIRGFAESSKPERSVLLYRQMKAAAKTEADSYTFLFLLAACSQPYLSREGGQLHGAITSNGYCSNIFVQTNLVNMYATQGGGTPMIKARQVFDEMPIRALVTWNSMLAGYLRSGNVAAACTTFHDMPERNTISWTAMISGFAQSGKCEKALAMFRKMYQARIEADQVTMISALSACAELGDLKLGMLIHSHISKKFATCFRQPQKEQVVSLCNALIHMYAKCGLINEAKRIFEEMPQRNVVSWTTMITGFAMHGQADDALDLFQLMRSVGVKPDGITFLGVLCACSHIGWVDKGREYFEQMTQVWHIKPKIEHYGCMVDLLSRAGLFVEAQRLIEHMPVKPNHAVWGALLGGCRIHKNTDLAIRVSSELRLNELESDRASGYLVLLSNVYATAKTWDEAVRVREIMVRRGLRKPSGRSWIPRC